MKQPDLILPSDTFTEWFVTDAMAPTCCASQNYAQDMEGEPELQRIEREMEAAAIERENWQKQVTTMLYNAEVLYRQINDRGSDFADEELTALDQQLGVWKRMAVGEPPGETETSVLQLLVRRVRTLRLGLREVESRCLPIGQTWAINSEAYFASLEELLELSCTRQTFLSDSTLQRLRQLLKATAERLSMLLQQPQFVTCVLRPEENSGTREKGQLQRKILIIFDLR
eukprot:s2531_g16.t1